jgi:hypothetical protein
MGPLPPGMQTPVLALELAILHGLGGSYDGAVALLPWFTWPKWLGLAGYFAAMAPALWQSGGAFRGASVLGVLGALAVRGVLAEMMAAGMALAMLMMVLGSFRRGSHAGVTPGHRARV